MSDLVLNMILLFILKIVCISSKTINITVSAPSFPPSRLFALDKIKLAVDIAHEKIQTIIPRDQNILFSFVNSNASRTDTLVSAIREMDKGANLIIGPVCDYSLLDVAKYTPRWHVPIISPGGFAHWLLKKNKFGPTLVRIHATFNVMAEFIYNILYRYQWKTANLISEQVGRKLLYNDFCTLAIDAIYKNPLYKKRFKFNKYEILREKKKQMALHVLEEINTRFSGELIIKTFCMIYRGRRGRDRMVVGFTITYAYHH